MLRKLWKWLRRGWKLDGYRCDDCHRWFERRCHPRARVVTVHRMIPAAGPLVEMEYDAMLLLCEECAGKRARAVTKLTPRGTTTGRTHCAKPNLTRAPRAQAMNNVYRTAYGGKETTR